MVFFSTVVCPTICYHSNWYGSHLPLATLLLMVWTTYSRIDCWHYLWTIWAALWSRWFLLSYRWCLSGRYLLHQHHVRIVDFSMLIHTFLSIGHKYRSVRLTHLLRLDAWRTERPSADGEVLVDKIDCYVHLLPVIRGASSPMITHNFNHGWVFQFLVETSSRQSDTW